MPSGRKFRANNLSIGLMPGARFRLQSIFLRMPAGRPRFRIKTTGCRTGLKQQQRAEGEMPHLMVRGNACKGQTGRGIFAPGGVPKVTCLARDPRFGGLQEWNRVEIEVAFGAVGPLQPGKGRGPASKPVRRFQTGPGVTCPGVTCPGVTCRRAREESAPRSTALKGNESPPKGVKRSADQGQMPARLVEGRGLELMDVNEILSAPRHAFLAQY